MIRLGGACSLDSRLTGDVLRGKLLDLCSLDYYLISYPYIQELTDLTSIHYS